MGPGAVLYGGMDPHGRGIKIKKKLGFSTWASKRITQKGGTRLVRMNK